MKDLLNFKSLNLHKFNNAEHTSLIGRFISLSEAAGMEVLHYEEADMTRLNLLYKQMQDLVAHTSSAAETPEMQQLEEQRDKLGQYIIDTARNGASLPIASKAAAATELYRILKPYVGFYSLPNEQETVVINGMIADLAKEENTAHMATLGLTDYLIELSSVNAKYDNLSQQRSATRNASQTENSKTLRAEIDALYAYITTVAFAHNVVTPTEALAGYISMFNTYIDEANTAYNLRMAQGKKEEEETETPEKETE